MKQHMHSTILHHAPIVPTCHSWGRATAISSPPSPVAENVAFGAKMCACDTCISNRLQIVRRPW